MTQTMPPVLCAVSGDFAKLTAIVGTDLTDQGMLDRLCGAIEDLSRDDLEALLLFGVLVARQATVLLATATGAPPTDLAASAPDRAADVAGTTDGDGRG